MAVSHDDLIQAVAYCRLSAARPVDDAAFEEAKRRGLLSQDPVWRATTQGEGALIAAGLMKGKPAPERRCVTILWAICDRYQTPQFVGAFNSAFEEFHHEEFERQIAEAKERYEDYGDEHGWHYWTTDAYVDLPEPPCICMAERLPDGTCSECRRESLREDEYA